MNKIATKQPLSKLSPIFLIATMLGLGKIPIAPGTIGSLVAALEFSLYVTYLENVMVIYAIYLICILPIIIYVIDAYCRSTRNKDPKEVIIDEYYGQYIAQLLAYIICQKLLINDFLTYLLISVSFVFFRIFDISKISLIGYVDKNIKNAFGVLLDDIVAGLFAALCTILMMLIIYNIFY